MIDDLVKRIVNQNAHAAVPTQLSPLPPPSLRVKPHITMLFTTRTSLRRVVHPLLSRAASTRPSGLAQILEKNPDDVVITFAKRTVVGRAKKGQLKDVPVDEMLHALFKVPFVNFIILYFGLPVCLGGTCGS